MIVRCFINVSKHLTFLRAWKSSIPWERCAGLTRSTSSSNQLSLFRHDFRTVVKTWYSTKSHQSCCQVLHTLFGVIQVIIFIHFVLQETFMSHSITIETNALHFKQSWKNYSLNSINRLVSWIYDLFLVLSIIVPRITKLTFVFTNLSYLVDCSCTLYQHLSVLACSCLYSCV